MDYFNYSYSNYDQSIDNNYSNYGEFHYLRNGDKQSDDYFHLFPSCDTINGDN